MKQLLFYCLILVWASIPGKSQTIASLEVGKTYQGFKLIEKRFVEEVNAPCFLFEHTQSGAQLFKIAADDPNKLFNVSFRTIPENSTGVAHIMEHAVLNGSKSFPVKSPFDILLQGSLNTFINAMTGPETTRYPVSSMNLTDYFNLMHVYLDAVFFPNIYTDPRIFMQEGWHYELDDVDEEIVYKGVVYNEMKGAYSSPTRELFYQVNKRMFPDNTFGVCSGGYPSEIPQLSYEEFVDFHRTFYHPSNSFIFLYGDADLMDELSFIHEEYLSDFERSDKVIGIKKQKPVEEMQVVHAPYAVPEGSSTENRTFLSLSFTAGEGTDLNLTHGLNVLASVLVNNETAPLRLALQEAGIGRNASATVLDGVENLFMISVQDAQREDLERFREIVYATMEEVKEKGFDKEDLEGVLNRNMFSYREGNTPNKGFMYMYMNSLPWLYADDPFIGLEFEQQFDYLQKALKEPLLENMMKQYLMDNSHAVLLALYPQPGLDAENARREQQELARYKASLSQAELEELVEQTHELKEFQEREDTPEAIASVPMLSLDDISDQVNWYELEQKSVDEIPVYHYNEFTNDILYVDMYFDMRVLPAGLLPYARLLSSVIRQLDTREMSYGDINNAFNIHTGGFWTYLTSFSQNRSEQQVLPYWVAGGKVAADKAEKYFELAAQTLSGFSLEDKDRLQAVLSRHKTNIERQLSNQGHNFAVMRHNSYLSASGMFDELTGGLSYVEFVRNLMSDFDGNYPEIKSRLRQTAQLLFDRKNMMVQVTCPDENYEEFHDGFTAMAALPATGSQPHASWTFNYTGDNEAMISSSMVQYVVQGSDYKKMGYEYNGKMLVLSQILSRDYLQKRLRVMGGAYGGWSEISPNGTIRFVSYRDPNLKETLDNYQGIVNFLEDFDADDASMTRFIIGTISRLDQPGTPNVKGQIALRRKMEGLTKQIMEKERKEVLSTSGEDIRQFASLIRDVLAQNRYCVYGGEEKIKQHAALFQSLIQTTE